MTADQSSQGPEWLDTAPEARPPRRRFAWAALPLAAVLAGAGVLVVRAQSDPPTPPEAGATRSPRPAPHRTSPPPPAGVAVTQWTRHLLGVRQGWELYGRGDREVVRLQFAAGRLTRTRVARLADPNSASFVVTGGAAVARSLSPGPGYLVRDGHRARPLTDPQLQSGLLLRGARSDEVWSVRLGGDAVRASLIRLRHLRKAGPVVAIQASRLEAIASDAAGGLVVRIAGRTVAYRGVPDGPARYRGTAEQPVPRGTVVASGANTWILADCAGTRCPARVVDRGSGRTRTLNFRVGNRWMSGSVSPDGRYLALLTRATNDLRLVVLDLVTGRQTDALPPPMAPNADLTSLAWAPDGRRLFALDWRGTLWLAEPRRARIRPVGLDLPPLRQLAIEP